MGSIHEPAPVLLVVAAISRYSQALVWAREQLESHFGPVWATSAAFDFTETQYYASTMGDALKKQFIAFEHLIDPAHLPAIKHQSNALEAAHAARALHPEPRPLNLDPGYITPAKLVLASTKDHSHRIYVGEGIFAEITLSYRQRRWDAHDWTYPDYRRGDFQQFFSQCRQRLLNCRANNDAVK